jgi:hypothetical protein
VEFYLRHVLARQGHDTSARLKDIKIPTLVLVGEDEGDPKAAMSHRTSSDILAKGIPNANSLCCPSRAHYFFVEPTLRMKRFAIYRRIDLSLRHDPLFKRSIASLGSTACSVQPSPARSRSGLPRDRPSARVTPTLPRPRDTINSEESRHKCLRRGNGGSGESAAGRWASGSGRHGCGRRGVSGTLCTTA